MKHVAVLALILGQLWLASPLCCCSLKAAFIGKGASSEGGCCCASGDEEQQGSGSPERDRDCQSQECGDCYLVEPDAFGDGCMTYYVGFLTRQRELSDAEEEA